MRSITLKHRLIALQEGDVDFSKVDPEYENFSSAGQLPQLNLKYNSDQTPKVELAAQEILLIYNPHDLATCRIEYEKH